MSKKKELSGRTVGGRSSADVQIVWYVAVCKSSSVLIWEYIL